MEGANDFEENGIGFMIEGRGELFGEGLCNVQGRTLLLEGNGLVNGYEKRSEFERVCSVVRFGEKVLPFFKELRSVSEEI